VLSKLLCQIPLADHNIAGWETMVNFAAIERDFIRDGSEFFFFLSSGAFSPYVICFETTCAGDNRNSEATDDHDAGSAVQDNPSRNSGKEIHNNSNALDRLIGTSKSKLRRHKREDYKSLRPKLRGRRRPAFYTSALTSNGFDSSP
jgi:hypothetical protein